MTNKISKKELEEKYNLIPVSSISIKKDPSKTIGYDFTVEDYFTFSTHDGVYVQDCMALYFPITEESKNDVKERIGIWNNLLSQTDITLVPRPNQDIILGIYGATQINNGETTDDMLTELVEYKGVQLSRGRALFNKCLPEDYPIIDDVIDKRKLLNLLNKIVLSYPPSKVIKTLDKIKNLGFSLSTIRGYTLGLDDIFKEELLKKNKELTGNIVDDMNIIENSEEVHELLDSLPFSQYIKSGARGSWKQAKQLVFTRGYVSDSKGNIRPDLIRSSMVEGLNQKEFFESCYGARKGLLDTALSTGDSGYLTRQLIYSCINYQIDHNKIDCCTKDYLEIYVRDKKMARVLLWRNYVDDNGNVIPIRTSNINDIIGKNIKLRSPIYCESEKICKTCYGNLHKILHSDEIGIMAVHSIGERLVQLVLRTFHESLSRDTCIIDVNNNHIRMDELYERININSEDIYTFSCSPDGKIVVSKVLNVFKDHITNKMVKITLDNKKIIKVTPDHEMMMRNGTYKKAKDLKKWDSLMPCYLLEYGTLSSRMEGRRRIQQNYKEPKANGYRRDLIFHLSSDHSDCEKINKTNNIHRHHIDNDIKNDYPTNIQIIDADEHIKMHGEDARIKASETRKQWHIDNPEKSKQISIKVRRTCIENILKLISDLKLEKTSTNFNMIREKYFKSAGLRYPTYKYAIKDHEDLMIGFIDDIVKKPRQQLHAESRMDRVLKHMEENNLPMTYGSFDKSNREIYGDKTHHREKMLELSPDYLNHLEPVGGERRIVSSDSKGKVTGKSRQQLQCESRMKKVLAKMEELDMPLTYTSFDKANEIVYPKALSRKTIEGLLKHSPDFLSHLVDDRVEDNRSKQQRIAETMMDKILQHMKDNNIRLCLSQFDKINKEMYGRKIHDREHLLKWSPDYLRNKLYNDYAPIPDPNHDIPCGYNHKVNNIEFIELDKEEEFYDLEVDNEYHNFPVSSGVFVHNSGVVNRVSDEDSDDGGSHNEDIISGINIANKLFHNPTKLKQIDGDENISKPIHLLKFMYSIFGEYKNIHMVHYEIIVSAMMWVDNDLWRLVSNRNDVDYEFVSILQIPSRTSWLLGAMFANLKAKLLEGLINNRSDNSSALTELFKY